MSVRLAQLFGWTFDYIDTLSVAQVRTIWAALGAQKALNKEGDWWKT